MVTGEFCGRALPCPLDADGVFVPVVLPLESSPAAFDRLSSAFLLTSLPELSVEVSPLPV